MSDRLRIMLVDDSYDSITALAALLKRKGYEVDWATNAESALEMIEENLFPVVITDWRMPGLNGVELAKIIKDRFPETKVILVTAYALQYGARGGGKPWVDFFMPKPLDPAQLLRTIQGILPAVAGEAPVGNSTVEASREQTGGAKARASARPNLPGRQPSSGQSAH